MIIAETLINGKKCHKTVIAFALLALLKTKLSKVERQPYFKKKSFSKNA